MGQENEEESREREMQNGSGKAELAGQTGNGHFIDPEKKKPRTRTGWLNRTEAILIFSLFF